MRFGRSEGVSTSTTDAGPLMGTAIDGDSVRVYLRRSHVLTSSKKSVYAGRQDGSPLTVASVMLPSTAVFQSSDASFGSVPELIVGCNTVHKWVADQVVRRTTDELFALKAGQFFSGVRMIGVKITP